MPGQSSAQNGAAGGPAPTQLRSYVFPSTAPGDDDDGGVRSPSTTSNTDEKSSVAEVSDHFDDVHAFDSEASPIAVSTPARSTQKAKGASRQKAEPHVALPPCLNVEELHRTDAPPPAPGKGGQRVRFAVVTEPPVTSTAAAMGADAATSPAAERRRRSSSNNGGFDYDVIESASVSSTDEDVSGDPLLDGVEPYSMITKTGGTHIHLFTQLLALLQRTARQYRRGVLALIAEVVAPLLFVVLVIVLNVAFGNEEVTERNYADPTTLPYQLNSLDYKTYVCYNDTTRPINGLFSCASLYLAHDCDGDDSGIPVYGLCYASLFTSLYSVVAQYVGSMLGSVIAVPTLDSIIVHQWLAKKAGLASSSRSRTALAALSDVGIGVSATTRYDSISYSGKLYFAPAANVPDALLAYLRTESSMFDYVYGGTFDTVAEAEAFVKNSPATQQSLDSIWGLIIIDDITDNFDVQIRLHGAALPALVPPVSVQYRSGFLSDGTDMYLASGYVTLQKVLYDYFYASKVDSGSLPNVASGALSSYGNASVYTLIASFPSVKSSNPYLFSFASSLVAFILVLAFLYPFSQLTKRLVLEKELRIRESMCIMGLKRSSLWLNFLLVSFLEYVLICILLTVLLCAVVVTRSSPFTIFLILLLYALTLIPLSGLLSTFFGRARMAALMSPLIYFVLSMPIFAMGSSGRGAVIGLSVLSPTALATLLTDVFEAESGEGFHLSDLHGQYFTATPYIILIMLGCDAALYLLVMFYLDAVLPQEWGTRKHPLFFLLEPAAYVKTWCCGSGGSSRKTSASAATLASTSNAAGATTGVEEAAAARELECGSDGNLLSTDETTVPTKMRVSVGAASSAADTLTSSYSLAAAAAVAHRSRAFDQTVGRDATTGAAKAVGVRVDSLTKVFVRNGKPFAAVKDFAWNMYRGEIAVLLGPNGAGKSTTINMVTGMLAADSGDCYIEGHSVSRHTALARHEIGYCPQHNILWPDLTCREHLEFYGKIKGLRGADLEDAVVDILRAVDLEEKIDCIPTLMSGGQKRKLSVAIAFVGRNSVVLLDEPTAGMDPAARRHTWSLLRAMAASRTIMLTTHYMDEADLLGDNVAIVSDGVLQCSGSTAFLRRYAGVGYTVRFDLSPIPAASGDEERQRRVEAVWLQLDQVVKRHLTGACLVLKTDAEVEYEMQRHAEANIPEFLKEMENRGNRQLGIRGYALKAPTLEDVFMRVVEHEVPTSAALESGVDPTHRTGGSISASTLGKPDPLSTVTASTSADRRVSGSVLPNSGTVGGGGNGGEAMGQPASPSRGGLPLQRRMSRASLRYYNNETRLNYAGDAEPSADDENDDDCDEEDDSTVATQAAVLRFRNAMKNPHNRSGVDFHRGSSTGVGGEEQEPGLRSSFVFGAAADDDDAAPSPLASSNRGATTSDVLAVESEASTVVAALPVGRSSGERAGGGGEPFPRSTPPASTTAAAAAAAGAGAVALTAVDGPVSDTAATAVVRNEAYLYKHVTDRHLDQVWAARAITSSSSLWALQMRSMMYKRFFCAVRDRRMLFFQIVCPVLCILLAMLLQLVKSSNTGTVDMSPALFRATATMPVSGCARYYGLDEQLISLAKEHYGTEITDDNFMTSGDLSYQMLDTWFTHSRGRYVALQCSDSIWTRYMQLLYRTTIGSRSVSTILYNTSSHNSLPVAMHYAYALAYFAGLGDATATFKMSVSALPASSTTTQASNAIAGILIGVIVLIPFTFLPANPVAWVVKEYETRARHLQTVSGLRYLIYWAGNFLFDFTAYVVTIILVMVIFVIFQRSEYIGYATIGPTIVAFAVYGVCYCCGAYLVSFFFKEHTTAQLVVLGVSFLTGFLCVMLVFVLSLLDRTLSASNTLRWIFRLLPPFSLGEVILNLALLEQKKLTDDTLTAWSMSITVWPIIYMAAEIPVFAAATLLWDHPNRRAVVERLQSCFYDSCCACGVRGRKERRAAAAASANKTKKNNKKEKKDAVNSSNPAAALSGGRGRRPSATDPAITPAAQRRAQAEGGSGFATSPSLRRRRSSGGGSAAISVGHTASDPMPDGVLISATSPQHPASSRQDRNAGVRLPTVLFTGETVDTGNNNSSSNNAKPLGTRRGSRGGLRRQSVADSVRQQLSVVSSAPANMVYPPSKWYVADRVRLEEEDSDVEEERGAVYAEERQHLADGHARHAAPPRKEKQHKKNPHGKAAAAEDHGPATAVAHGGEDVDESHTAADVIRVVDLRKVYSNPHKVAVSGVNFSVMHGEVFGFLGTNGAGKSSALSILTQEQLPTNGRAYVCGHDVVRDSFAAANCLGYCPQFDACLDLLTVKEHLRMYALVRGVPVERTDDLIASLLTICNLVEHRNVLSSDLSGGNRRKLSVAIALIGAPRVVCLDEPTSGLDPLARRLLWRALDRVSRKCSIILTTHHLEEVEALADCVGIMVDGGLRCFGDLPHLKHKYARNAYELTLCVSPAARRAAAAEAAAQQGNRSNPLEKEATAASPSRSYIGSVSYAGTDHIDTSDSIFQFMLRNFPSALLVDNFNNERYVYTLPATRDVANAMLQLQNRQQRRHSVSFRCRSTTSGYGSGTGSSFNGTILRLSDVFEKLRASQAELGITQYSVSQVSLEQVFLRVCGSTEESKTMQRRLSTLSINRPSSPSFYAGSSPNASRYVSAGQGRQLQRQRRSSSIYVANTRNGAALGDVPSPARRRLSVAALGGPATRLTFSSYRRQRALLRLRAEAAVSQPTPAEAQRATEPDHFDSS